jgi:hypothetical protein
MDHQERRVVPLWLNPEYWIVRLEIRMDRNGPRRSVSRSRVVRLVRAALGQFSLRGWIWAVLALVSLIALVRGWSTVYQIGTAALCLVWAVVGYFWARFNLVYPIDVVVECECGRDLEGEL